MKKHIISLLALASTFSGAYGQTTYNIPADTWSSRILSQDKSMVIKKTYTAAHKNPSPSGYNASVTYFDNLGFTEQHIEVDAAPGGGDIVTHAEHDYLWREDGRTYLPYVQATTSSTKGAFVSNAKSLQNTWYYDRYGGAFIGTGLASGNTVLPVECL